jgi:hypothetical protein
MNKSKLIVVAALLIAGMFLGVNTTAKASSTLDVLIDRCSTDVVVITALGNTTAPGGDIRLRRTASTSFSWSVVSPVNSPRISWACGTISANGAFNGTQEASTCPGGTHHIQAELGSDRALFIDCEA